MRTGIIRNQVDQIWHAFRADGISNPLEVIEQITCLLFIRRLDEMHAAEELKAIFDPQGGQWIEGRYVPSLLAAIGEVIEAHMIRIGFLKRS